MIGVLREPIEVKVVGGGHDLLDLVGPALVALAAICAAIVAAHTANKRQREQLAHDFSLREREHIRDALDTAIDKATQAVGAISALEGALGVAEAMRSQEQEGPTPSPEESMEEAPPQSPSPLEEQLEAQIDEIGTHLVEMRVQVLRLKMRLDSDEIPHLYKKTADKLNEQRDGLERGIGGVRTEQEIASSKALDAQGTEDFAPLLEACSRWFNQNTEQSQST